MFLAVGRGKVPRTRFSASALFQWLKKISQGGESAPRELQLWS